MMNIMSESNANRNDSDRTPTIEPSSFVFVLFSRHLLFRRRVFVKFVLKWQPVSISVSLNDLLQLALKYY